MAIAVVSLPAKLCMGITISFHRPSNPVYVARKGSGRVFSRLHGNAGFILYLGDTEPIFIFHYLEELIEQVHSFDGAGFHLLPSDVGP